MTGEDIKRAIEFLLRHQATFDERLMRTQSRKALRAHGAVKGGISKPFLGAPSARDFPAFGEQRRLYKATRRAYSTGERVPAQLSSQSL